MNCRSICEHLSAYLDGELPGDLAEQVRDHVASCVTCRGELDSLRELTGVLHALPREPAPEAIEQEVVLYIEEDILLRKPDRARWVTVARNTLTGLGLVAAALLVGLSVWMYFTPYAERPSDVTVTEYTVAKTSERGDLAKALTAEGTSVVDDAEPTRRTEAAPAPVAETGTEHSFAWKGGPTKTRGKDVAEGKKVWAGTRVLDRKTKEVLDKPTSGLTSVVAAPPPATPAPDAAKQTSTAEVVPSAPVVTRELLEDAKLAEQPVGKKVPAGPEFLDLELVDDDFDAARRHVITVANSLDIPSVDVDIESLRRLLQNAYHGKVEPDGARRARTDKKDDILAAGWYESKTSGKGVPAVVLVVDEERLPRLVAKLAAPRPRYGAAAAVTEGYQSGTTQLGVGGTSATKPGLRTKSKELEKTETAEPAAKPGKDVRMQVIEEIDRMALETRARTRRTDARSAGEGPGPRPARTPDADEAGRDNGKLAMKRAGVPGEKKTPVPADALATDTLKERQDRKKLVYLRVYLRRPPARPTPAARTTPASK